MHPKVLSIIIPVYNEEKTIHLILDKIKSSTYRRAPKRGGYGQRFFER
jgi:glycosyltransferase involved in cell wall biosynthesis